MAKPVIYLSSTFSDLREHRSTLLQVLRETRLFEVIGMEDYGTINETPLYQCLKDVASCEFYILLIGKRYGFIPPGEKWSITNLEYKAAIDDNDNNVAAVAYRRDKGSKRCVLPFVLDERYELGNDIDDLIKKEKDGDGNALTAQKEAKYNEFKNRILSDFTISKRFTRPADLGMMVMAALIPELVSRNYASVREKLLLPDNVVNRCDRIAPTNRFRNTNKSIRNQFFKSFIIHGEETDLPEEFSKSISNFELRNSEIKPLQVDCSYVTKDELIENVALECHKNLFTGDPANDPYSFMDMALDLVVHPTYQTVVFQLSVGYIAWERTHPLMLHLFRTLNSIQVPGDTKGKSVYFLVNLYYNDPDSEIAKHEEVNVLPRLAKVTDNDIRNWIQTYFTEEDKIGLPLKIKKKYFPGVDAEFTMAETAERLEKIVADYNAKRELFAGAD
ncbi:DUF4062 domain-containing protein [Hufsiella ginkgonis]|uniref:DUF4062 domain-containing protein n=1 Tax=Hufsiella ginkgonis TaxID=2695274 RepID=A0A7K1XYJ4_9SPHI|nr:DUF4062 domain-containing protein [Hufsiella ginkgonis]MXV16022.1 DUF4062 domain-containing protein [Hufsiella ginkgonis]